MSERFQIDIDELHRGLTCAALIALSVAFCYKALDFSVNTVRTGLVNTWTVLGARAQRTMETLVNPIEDLIMNADELGAANLFERYPYPVELRINRKLTGIGQFKINKFVLIGSNLDVLRRVEVNLEGVSVAEETDVETAPSRDTERFEWPAKLLTQMTASPVKGTVMVLGSGGSRWRHVLPVRLDDEQDDSMLASRPKKQPAGGTTSSSSGGSSNTPSAAPTASPTVVAETDDGQMDLAQLIEGMTVLAPKRRAAYVKAVRDEAFKEAELSSLLSEVHRSKAKSADLDALVVKVLSARYMTARRVRGAVTPLHGASPSEVQKALEYRGRATLLNEIDIAGSVNDGIRSVLGKSYTASLVPAATTASTAPGETPASVAATAQPEGKYEEGYFQQIWEQELKYKDCMAIVDLLQKAYDVDNQDSVAPGPFDMTRLQTKGHLEYVPSCPDGDAGGTFQLDPNSKKVRCTKHGNRALPWAERRLYEVHFNEFERARILVRKQNRVNEAIGTLRAYLARDRGREEANLMCQAYLGRLYFETANHEAAVDILKRLADKYPKSVRLAYQTALCFYVRANEQLALEYTQQALKPEPKDFDHTFDPDSTAYDLYLLRDECRWMQANLAPVRVMPDGERRPLPPVRYADFAIKSRPASHAKVCYENLAVLRDLVVRVVRGVRLKKEFQGRYQVQLNQKESLAKIPEYDKLPRLRGREALTYARRQLKDMSLEILKDAKVLNAAFTSCPGTGIFHLTNTKHLQVDCTVHPNILPAERIEVSPAVSDREAKMADLVLQHAMTTMSPPLNACVERQRRILEQFQNDLQEVAIPPESNLVELEREKRIPAGTLNPGGDEAYRLVVEGEKVYLECTTHYSLQRLAEIQDGVNTIEESKVAGGE